MNSPDFMGLKQRFTKQAAMLKVYAAEMSLNE